MTDRILNTFVPANEIKQPFRCSLRKSCTVLRQQEYLSLPSVLDANYIPLPGYILARRSTCRTSSLVQVSAHAGKHGFPKGPSTSLSRQLQNNRLVQRLQQQQRPFETIQLNPQLRLRELNPSLKSPCYLLRYHFAHPTQDKRTTGTTDTSKTSGSPTLQQKQHGKMTRGYA